MLLPAFDIAFIADRPVVPTAILLNCFTFEGVFFLLSRTKLIIVKVRKRSK